MPDIARPVAGFRPAAALVLLSALIAGLVPPGAAAAADAAVLPAVQDLDVLLIVIDTLGAKHLGCHTPGVAGTTTLDSLAASGVRFERTYSPAPWTQPAFGSLFTGRMPSAHGVMANPSRLPDEERTLAEIMRDLGHRTASIYSNMLLSRRYGFGQGFDSSLNASAADFRATTSARVTDLALRQLDSLRDQRSFVFVHYFDPHYAYMPLTVGKKPPHEDGLVYAGMRIRALRKLLGRLSPDDVGFLRELYAEDITRTDREVGRLLAGLRELGLSERTLVVLTADHGEELMEHGWVGHGTNLYEDLLHVPLFFSLPGVLEPGRVVSSVASLNDIVPTFLDLGGEDVAAAGLDGISLLPDLAGEVPRGSGREVFAEVSFRPQPGAHGADTGDEAVCFTSLTVWPYKVIHDLVEDSWQFFDLLADPGELTDLFGDGRPALMEMQRRLLAWEEPRTAAWIVVKDTETEVDEETRRRLRSLGY